MFNSLKSKLSFGLIFLNISSALALTISGYFLSISMYEDNFKNHALSTAKFIANYIDSDTHSRFNSISNFSDTIYIQYKKVIKNHYFSNKNLKQIYTLNYNSKLNKLYHTIDSNSSNKDIISIDSLLFSLDIFSENKTLQIQFKNETYKNNFILPLLTEDLKDKITVIYSESKKSISFLLGSNELLKADLIENEPALSINTFMVDKENKSLVTQLNVKGKTYPIKIIYNQKLKRESFPGLEFNPSQEQFEKIIDVLQSNVDYIDEEPNLDSDGKFLNAYGIIRDNLNHPTGIVIIEVDYNTVDEFRNKFIFIVGLIFLAVIVIGIFISLFLATYFTKPLVLLIDAVETLGSGNLEALVDISSDDEFGKLAKSYNLMVSNLKIASEVQYNLITEISRLNDNLEQKVAQRTKTIQAQSLELEKQIQVAQKIQSSLLPAVIPDIQNASVNFLYQPMMGVGGDFIDIHYRTKRELILFICDVSGHGIPAAFLATMVKMTLHTCFEKKLSPEDALQMIWSTLRGKMSGHFISAIYSKIDLNSGIMTIANAGHLSPICISNDGDVKNVLIKGRVISEGIPLKVEQQKIKLNSGDKFLFYTDGVTEARNSENKMLGEEKLFEILEKNYTLSTELLCNTIYNSVLLFTGNEIKQFTDDITILAVEYRK